MIVSWGLISQPGNQSGSFGGEPREKVSACYWTGEAIFILTPQAGLKRENPVVHLKPPKSLIDRRNPMGNHLPTLRPVHCRMFIQRPCIGKGTSARATGSSLASPPSKPLPSCALDLVTLVKNQVDPNGNKLCLDWGCVFTRYVLDIAAAGRPHTCLKPTQ